MTVLVTGGAGYIGSHMVWDLLDSGEDVIVIDRLSTGFDWAVAPDAKLIIGDIGDTKLVSEILAVGTIDAIIHFAGSVVVPESVSNPLSYYENNTCKTRCLIETAVRAGIPHFIFSSTAAVYGNAGVKPITEKARLSPLSPYGKSKLMAETMLEDTANATGLKHTILRYFNVAGADTSGRTGQSTAGATHLIKVACETAIGKRASMDVFGTNYDTPDGTCIRDYIHVSDLVAAHRLALKRLRNGGGNLTANCGYGHGYSVLEVIDSVRKVFGRDFDVKMGQKREGDAASVVADSRLLRRELEWSPKHDDLAQICADALNWEQILMRRNRR